MAPTAAEMRRAAIYSSYRAIVDMTAAGGYGTLFGPNVAAYYARVQQRDGFKRALAAERAAAQRQGISRSA